MTHDYKRHGTTSLFVALDVASGAVIGETYRRHRHQEVLKFLRRVERAVPKEQEIHIILDNYSTHKHARVMEWIERKKRIFLHFTPDQLVVAESGRAVLLRADHQADPPRRLPFRRRPREVPQGLHRDLQRRSEAPGLDQVGGRDYRKGGPGQEGSGRRLLIITIMIRTVH